MTGGGDNQAGTVAGTVHDINVIIRWSSSTAKPSDKGSAQLQQVLNSLLVKMRGKLPAFGFMDYPSTEETLGRRNPSPLEILSYYETQEIFY